MTAAAVEKATAERESDDRSNKYWFVKQTYLVV